MFFGLFSRGRGRLAPPPTISTVGTSAMGGVKAGEELLAVVAQKRTVADGVIELVLHPKNCAEFPEWQPGAHVDLVLANGFIRQYSLCGNPNDRSVYKLGILRDEHGRGGSIHVHDKVQIGETVELRGPRNHFAFIPEKKYIFIAGGIGITPIIPMIDSAEASSAQWVLFYGGRRRASMAYVDELTRYGDRVSIHPQDELGMLNLGAILSSPAPETLIYCCGPEPLLNAVEEECAKWPSQALHLERFSPKVISGSPLAKPFTAHLVRSGKTIFVPPNRSLASVLADAGIDVPTSCNEGTCGTCETVVCGGIPDHRDSVLSDAERQSNKVMLVCVSRALTTDIELDL